MSEAQVHEANVERVRQLLEAGDAAKLHQYLEAFHPSDIADVIESLDDEQRASVLAVLSDEVASATLAEMEEEEHPEELLVADPERVAELVRELSADDAADIIGDLPSAAQQEVLAQLPLTDAAELRDLLAYDEETAGGVMTTDVVSVAESASVNEAIEEIRRQAAEGEDFYSVFVVDRDGRLLGTVSLQDLVLSQPTRRINEVIEPVLTAVPVSMDQEEVARVMSRYNLVSIPVVDPAQRLIGRITFDDVMDIVEAETTEDILRFSGSSAEEYLAGGVGQAIKNRLPWLALALLTTSVAAVVIYLFRSVVEQAVILAAIMPVIAALGGNAGTQALAVTVRRLALDPDRHGTWRVVGKELAVGLVNGAVIGSLAAIIGYLIPEGSVYLGFVVMFAMWGNLIVAGFAGAFVPVLLEKLGADPAVASSVFFTALTDIFGFFFLLGLASWILLPQLG
ncbi:MAG: magnesium transporter [Gemmatimonadetes bacterium]|uniref:Magnesium transporter MgtE n=1 Tax=Candidatus Kutchimonas denitrificans TaxID=3056748 RepID=A0AAE4ZAN2_9BACT|nr:magnesium transporter [Gemmatimonadota bacterium]NIR74621.1 magnesium transporter [Candidatus Kutchimonas denitrificans]NIS02811.1 magnesium transporter [Gemmatimonadota bacterium]NIT68972.1 magnesium transporter [Gemmatimonadota bacterium]NIU52277.1 magnesium transporter [Gemmatimonadota bacterium]